MKFFIHIMLLSSVIFVALACKNSNKNYALTRIPVISFDPEAPEERGFEDGISLANYRLFPLNTISQSLVAGVDKVLFNKDLIYIIDMNKELAITIFDTTGNFVSKLKKIGRGPEEYTSINDVRIINNTGEVELLVNNSEKLITYDSLGNFKGYSTLNFSGFFKFYRLGEKIAFYNTLQIPLQQQGKGNHGYRLTISKANSPNQSEKMYLPFQFDRLKEPDASISLENFTTLPFTKDTVALFEALSDTIFNVTSKGVSPRYVIQFKGEEHKEKENILEDKKSLNKSAAIENKKLTKILNYLENERYIVIQYSYFSKVQKFYIIGHALYDKKAKKTKVFPAYNRLPAKTADGPFYFDSSVIPLFMDDKGRFVSIIYQYYLNDLEKTQDDVRSIDTYQFYRRMKAKSNFSSENIESNPAVFLYNYLVK